MKPQKSVKKTIEKMRIRKEIAEVDENSKETNKRLPERLPKLLNGEM